VVVEYEVNIGPAWIIKRPVLIAATRCGHGVVHANLDVLIPFLLLYRATVDF
jgi:hypothetical protein